MTLNLSAKISNKRVLNALSALALYSVASSVGAAVLNKDNIAFVGPLAEQMQVKPYQTPHHDAAIKNLLPSLQANSSHISVFGEQHKWQALSSVNALTLGGIKH